MSNRRIQKWTCDRCAKSEETEIDKQPVMWRGFVWTNPGVPLAEMASDVSKPQRVHLCGACSRRVLDEITTPPASAGPAGGTNTTEEPADEC